jgi:DNA-binding response OmpR family regulator
MSDAIVLTQPGEAEAKRTPTVYFIDDSATMREVIKIAFRRENINVITCADASSALEQFEQNPPDIVITDVIMPDTDGYSVCSQVKQNPQFAKTPVILMSGVVNKSVADRAVAVQADELVRKPFQPQELLTRVKNLIGHGGPALQQPTERPTAAPALSSLFAPAAPRVAPPAAAVISPAPRVLVETFVPQGNPGAPQQAAAAPTAPARSAGNASDLQKLRVEISRLELQVKKLQTELQIERQYNQALELHVRTLTQVE